jgi:hypothetical protein
VVKLDSADVWVEVPAEVTEVGSAPQFRLQVATRYAAGMTPLGSRMKTLGFGFPIQNWAGMVGR